MTSRKPRTLVFNPVVLSNRATPLTTYTDENGRTVTVCPARYAEGAESRPTARPVRGVVRIE